MDTEVFCNFISNCLHINAICFNNDWDILEKFQEKNCFDEKLQPMYTADSLKLLASSAKDGNFYEINDYVNTNLLLFNFEGHFFIVGPYINTYISDKELHELLAKQGLSLRIFEQLRHYCNRFPLINYSYLTDIVLAAMRSFVPMTSDFTKKSLKGFHEEIDESGIINSAENSYLAILARYQFENAFLRMIEEGNEKEVLKALQGATSTYEKSTDSSSLNYYSDNNEGFTVIRTLARKAAELGGCPVIKIDEITQEAIQKVHNSKSVSEINKVQLDMIIALTRAVADSKALNNYSVLIRNLVIYINSNYSKEISLSGIAEGSHISKEHLSRMFKKETGVTITEYVATARLKKATELLTTTNLSISEISELVGYSDNNYFVKVFRKYYKMTPSQYRHCGMNPPKHCEP